MTKFRKHGFTQKHSLHPLGTLAEPTSIASCAMQREAARDEQSDPACVGEATSCLRAGSEASR